MPSFSSTQMRSAVLRILRAHGMLEAFTNSRDFAVRIHNVPYLPLTIERHGQDVSVTHYFTQNGDLVPDPDMAFELLHDGAWLPVSIQFATGMYCRASEVRDGKRFVNPRELRDQVRFSTTWARNLIQQGFHRGQAERID